MSRLAVPILLTLAVLSPAGATPATARKKAAPANAEPKDIAPTLDRRPENRVLTLTDDVLRTSVPELRVAPGVPTTIVFPVKVDKKTSRLADTGGLFYPLLVNQNQVVLAAKSELAANASVPLSIGLDDGTLISFVLRAAGEQADFQVTVELQLTKPSAPESVEALKRTIADLQARVDELQANSATAAIARVASLVLSQEPGTAAARTFEQHRVHSRDKQSRLVVEAHHLYRLFSHSYLLLTVENRDPSRVWVLDRAEVRLLGGPESASVKVAYVESDLKSVASEETARVVVVFDTPPQSSGQKLAIVLLEKGGGRHVTLEVEP